MTDPLLQERGSDLDYFGVRPSCGCVTAWLSAESTEDERGRFFRSMTVTGRDVIRGKFDEYRDRIERCPHQVDEYVAVVPLSVAENLATALEVIADTPCETHWDEADGADVDEDGRPTVDHQCRACRASDALHDFRAVYPREETT